jgi:hypothetical protein
MATNFEYYKDKILEIIKNGSPFAVEDNKPVSCRGMKCYECDFVGTYGDCNPERFKWLYAEHIEKPKLTKRERAFCEAVQTGWIARDCDMTLCYFERKPIFIKDSWNAEGHYVYLQALGLNDEFMFIKDTDAECWSVEDLMKLDVIEEVQEDA